MTSAQNEELTSEEETLIEQIVNAHEQTFSSKGDEDKFKVNLVVNNITLSQTRELTQSWCEQSPRGDWNRGYLYTAGNSPNLGVSNHLEVIRTGATYIPAENSPNLRVSHHFEVLRTGATYIPAGNSSNLGVSHHLEVIEMGYLHPSRELAHPWCESSP